MGHEGQKSTQWQQYPFSTSLQQPLLSTLTTELQLLPIIHHYPCVSPQVTRMHRRKCLPPPVAMQTTSKKAYNCSSDLWGAIYTYSIFLCLSSTFLPSLKARWYLDSHPTKHWQYPDWLSFSKVMVSCAIRPQPWKLGALLLASILFLHSSCDFAEFSKTYNR